MAASRVEFVSDDEVMVVRGSRASSWKGCQPRIIGDSDSEPNRDDDSDSDVEKENLIKPVSLYSDSPFTGKEVFGFKTPKKGGALAQAASEALHVKTPRTSKKSARQKAVGKGKAKAPQTAPTAARRSSRRRPNASQGNESRDGEDGVCDDSSLLGTKSGPAAPVATRSHKPQASAEDMGDMLDEYFYQQSTRCVTSDRTLAQLTMPQMDQQSLTAHLSMVLSSHTKEGSRMYAGYRKLFPRWLYLLRNSFNLLLYGLGSKRTLLEQFRASALQDQALLVVNGFFPSLTVKHILTSITQDLLQHEGNFKSVIEQCDFIRNNLREDLFLIVHNIDGAMLRASKTQTVLSILAEMDFVHMIASIDHINAPLIWDQSQSSRFNWLWYDVTTFESYCEETSYEDSLMVQQSGALALSSLTHVFRSLTPNARGIFILIASHQLEEKDRGSYNGLSFHDCYTKCREKFLVNSDLTLRAQLTEFRDHKLLRSKKVDGVEYLHIPVDASTLQLFVEDQSNNNG